MCIEDQSTGSDILNGLANMCLIKVQKVHLIEKYMFQLDIVFICLFTLEKMNPTIYYYYFQDLGMSSLFFWRFLAKQSASNDILPVIYSRADEYI